MLSDVGLFKKQPGCREDRRMILWIDLSIMVPKFTCFGGA